jgi:hypothetical protein
MTTADSSSSGMFFRREHLVPGAFTVFCAQCKHVIIFHIMDQLPLTPYHIFKMRDDGGANL